MDDINDTDHLISVATYLTRVEADSIKSNLSSLDIDFTINGHGATSRYSSQYYEIRVQRKDFERASAVVKSGHRKNLIQRQQCPKCKNNDFTVLEKKGVWKKIYYYGTTLVQCKKCRTQYPI